MFEFARARIAPVHPKRNTILVAQRGTDLVESQFCHILKLINLLSRRRFDRRHAALAGYRLLQNVWRATASSTAVVQDVIVGVREGIPFGAPVAGRCQRACCISNKNISPLT